ncbi:MAG: biotin/lipoyl-containing protein [Tepidiformaceae bacterium]
MPIVEVPAPMAGSIKEVLVAVGETVQAGQEVIIIESMKMEIPIESPAAASVAEILVAAPQPIAEGQVLLRLAV